MRTEAVLLKLGVTQVTLRNWIGQKLLTPAYKDDGGDVFEDSDVLKIKKLREQYGKGWIRMAKPREEPEEGSEPADETVEDRFPNDLAAELTRAAKRLRLLGHTALAAEIAFFIVDNWEINWEE